MTDPTISIVVPLYDEADNYLDPDEEPELADRRATLATSLNKQEL